MVMHSLDPPSLNQILQLTSPLGRVWGVSVLDLFLLLQNHVKSNTYFSWICAHFYSHTLRILRDFGPTRRNHRVGEISHPLSSFFPLRSPWQQFAMVKNPIPGRLEADWGALWGVWGRWLVQGKHHNYKEFIFIQLVEVLLLQPGETSVLGLWLPESGFIRQRWVNGY